jgi:hypothetical protein
MFAIKEPLESLREYLVREVIFSRLASQKSSKNSCFEKAACIASHAKEMILTFLSRLLPEAVSNVVVHFLGDFPSKFAKDSTSYGYRESLVNPYIFTYSPNELSLLKNMSRGNYRQSRQILHQNPHLLGSIKKLKSNLLKTGGCLSVYDHDKFFDDQVEEYYKKPDDTDVFQFHDNIFGNPPSHLIYPTLSFHDMSDEKPLLDEFIEKNILILKSSLVTYSDDLYNFRLFEICKKWVDIQKKDVIRRILRWETKHAKHSNN